MDASELKNDESEVENKVVVNFDEDLQFQDDGMDEDNNLLDDSNEEKIEASKDTKAYLLPHKKRWRVPKNLRRRRRWLWKK